MFHLTKDEEKLFKRLNTPAKIQDYLNSIPYNFETGGETCRSPREAMKHKQAHCFEGAMFAGAVLWYHGEKPLLLDLRSTKHDLDHVVTLFKRNGCWGAISKTNHAVLRYREPIYRTIRELALSYFHEYFLDDGTKTMRDYSLPFGLKAFGTSWVTSTDDLWDIGAALDDSRHISILPTKMNPKVLRKADDVEIAAGKLVEYKKSQRGFTLIELLVVIAIIGVLAGIVLAAVNSARSKAEIAKTQLEIKSLRNAVALLENDVGKWPNGCPIDAVANPEVDLDTPNAGLTTAPTVFSSGTCTWTASDIANWKGPYATNATDKWNHAYVFDPDYHLCENSLEVAYPVIVSYGPNGVQNYPLTGSGTCTAQTANSTYDDIYIKLIQ